MTAATEVAAAWTPGSTIGATPTIGDAATACCCGAICPAKPGSHRLAGALLQRSMAFWANEVSLKHLCLAEPVGTMRSGSSQIPVEGFSPQQLLEVRTLQKQTTKWRITFTTSHNATETHVAEGGLVGLLYASALEDGFSKQLGMCSMFMHGYSRRRWL